MPKATTGRSKTGSRRATSRAMDEHTALLLLKLEGCSINEDVGQHKYAIDHPQLVGVSICCDKLVTAVEAFVNHFKVM